MKLPRRTPRYRRRVVYTERLLQSLLDLYQLLRTPRPLDDLLQAILDTAIRYVPGAQRGSLLVRDGEALRYRATVGYDLQKLRPAALPVSVVYDLVLLRERNAQVDDYVSIDATYLDPETDRLLLEHGHVDQIRRSLVTAILVSDGFYGTLVLDNLHTHEPFPPDAQMLAQLFAEQAGTLIEQAILLDQLRQTRSVLVEAEKLASLGRFVASVAHEINNPLTAVVGYAEFLSLQPLDPESQEMLERLRAGADRVTAVVRNLQIFARQQRSGHSGVDVNLVVEQTLTLKQADLILDDIAVVRDLSAHLPLTWGDAGQLSQVLLNLFTNAQHALRSHHEQRWLKVLTRRAGDAEAPTIEIVVSDNGHGIAHEIIDRIFEPFFTTKPVGQGTGLGLSICYGIVSSHGGKIWADSQIGLGTAFTVALPVRKAPMTMPEPTNDVTRPLFEATPPHKLQILVVDDDEGVAAMVVRALSGSNQVLWLSRGEVALETLMGRQFDVVLCDLKMPGMNGADLFERLRSQANPATERIIFMSGDTSSRDTRRFLERAGRPVLMKPFALDDLYRSIHAVVR